MKIDNVCSNNNVLTVLINILLKSEVYRGYCSSHQYMCRLCTWSVLNLADDDYIGMCFDLWPSQNCFCNPSLQEQFFAVLVM